MKAVSVRKRTGKIVDFDKNKIINAIEKAMEQCDEHFSGNYDEIIEHIDEKLDSEILNVEEVQDTIISILHEKGFNKVGTYFTRYRERRSIARGSTVDSLSLVDEYLSQLDDMAVHENSSTMFSLQGLNNHIFSSISEKYWLSLYSDEIKSAFDKGRIHIHDLSVLGAYCCGWDLKQVITEGFGGVPGKPASAPPKHFSSALSQANNFIFTLQGEAAGAMAFSNFNTLLAPFVREDELTYREVKQSIQEFIFNLNISTRVGFQCVSEDTEILSENGWVKNDQLHKGDNIITFNIENNNLEKKEVLNVYREQYDGEMIHLESEYVDQLVTPNHKVVELDRGNYKLTDASDVYENDGDLYVPLAVIKDEISWGEYTGSSKITKKEKVEYSGIVWCPTTTNGTIIARRNGKVFITGNSPFSNLTLDLDATKTSFADQPAIIGGKYIDTNYSDYNKEATMINQAIVEVLSEGDKDGAMLSYPIITLNVTKEFPWHNKLGKTILESTARYGSFYFANYINSDYTDSDITSMCCRLKIDRKEIERHLTEYSGGLSEEDYSGTHQKGHGFFGASPNTGCYDEETEVLTKDGWKFWRDATENDNFITMNMENRKIEYQKPTTMFKYEHDGDMIEFKNTNVNLLVTPNHNMLAINLKRKNSKIELIKADDFKPNSHSIPKIGEWIVENEIKEFILPKIEITKYANSVEYVVKKEEIRIDIKLWAGFLGWFLSEGSVDNEKIAARHGYRVIITQFKEHNISKIEGILNQLPFKWTRDKNNYVICNKQLWTYMKQFGYSHEKFIPEYIKSSGQDVLRIFFDNIMLGDGNVRKTDNQQTYYTTSPKLKDDFQEVLIKLGMNSNVTARERKKITLKMGDGVYTTHNVKICYTIYISNTKHFRLRPKSVNRKYYKGNVYCAEVPNHTLFVRRGGKTTWCGNSVGVVTLGMPSIMHDTMSEINTRETKWEVFLDSVKYYMDLSMESLMKKRKVVEHYAELDLYPYLKHYLKDVKARTGHYFTQHFSTICPNGVHEALIVYGLEDGIMCEEGMLKAEELLKFMNEYSVVLQKENRVLVNIEQAPAESAGVKLCLKSGVDPLGNGYYTNSTWQPADAEMDMHDQIHMQGRLNVYYSGGSSMHTYTQNDLVPIKNDLDKIITYAFNNTKIPYMTISPVFSVCEKCGRIAGKHIKCPKCGSDNIEAYERVVGYYRPISRFNKGRKNESKKRNYLKLV